MILFPGLPLRLLTAGVGRPESFGSDSWRTTRTDFFLTGPAGFRSWLRIKVWSTNHKVPA